MNARQRKFAELYAAGPPKVRGNAVAAYRAADYHPRSDASAATHAGRLLKNVEIVALIQQYHAEADAAVIRQLRDWKTLAPQAQQQLAFIQAGYIPDPPDPCLPADVQAQYSYRKIRSRDDVFAAKLMADVAEWVIERAYPSKVYHELTLRNAQGLLASLLGVHPQQLPSPQALQDYARHTLGPPHANA